MNRLRIARKAKGLTQEEVAEYIGLTQPSYSDWERGGTKIASDSLSRLAQLFECSTDYLLGKSDDVTLPASVKVPVLGTIPAGIPLEAIENVLDWEEIPAEMASGNREYFGLVVNGDSMYPEYLPGDVVILRKTPRCESGDVCAVLIDGSDATLKRVRLGEDRSLTLVPNNPQYPPRTYSAEEIEALPVLVIGVAVELRRRVKK